MKKNIVFFDFDGTITTKDTLLEIIKYIKGVPAFYIGFAILSPWLIAMKLKLISNTRAKQRVLKYFFGNSNITEFNMLCEKFAHEVVPSLVRRKAMLEITKHSDQGSEIIVVSASPENFVSPWCRLHNLQCIATRLEIKNNKITGNINGANCYGIEKVNRILEKYDITQYDAIYAYGDSKGDNEMLSMATYSFFKPFRT